jgi:glycerophosphoryl diester phosphodiesterase
MIRILTSFILMTTAFLTVAQSRSTVLIAHRGLSSVAPENTLQAIGKALELGVDRIEIDVQMTRDGEVVLMHDRTLNRTTSGRGAVKNHDLKEIQALDAGSWFGPDYSGITVPSLQQTLELIHGRCMLMIEVKNHSGYTPGIEKKVAEIIRSHNAGSWCVVISLKHRVIRNFHLNEPDIRLHRSYVGKLPGLPIWVDGFITLRGFRQYPYVEEFNLNKGFITKCVVKKAARQGKGINAWTDDNPGHAEKLIKRGVKGIITNYPQRYISGNQ